MPFLRMFQLSLKLTYGKQKKKLVYERNRFKATPRINGKFSRWKQPAKAKIIFCNTVINAEVGKVTFKSNGDEALNAEFNKKITAMKC